MILPVLFALIAQTFPFPGPGKVSGAISISGPVHTCSNTVSSAGLTSVTCTFGGSVAAGNFLVACLNNSSASPTWSGDAATSVKWVTQFSDGVGNTLDCAYWASAVGGGSTITASAASINYPTIFAYEFAGVALSSPQDGSTTTAYGSSSSPACTALTPAANGELVISAITFGGTPTPSINSPFTAGFSSSGVYAFGGYYIQPSAGSIAATYGLSSSGGWGCVQAAFKHQ